MTTILRSKFGHCYLSLETVESASDRTVSVRLTTPVGDNVGHIQRVFLPDEFLAAVATELNVLVIPRTDLPKVTDTGQEFETGPVRALKDTSPAMLRRISLSYLALAEYLDAHPPIDQAQVDALARLLAEDDGAVSWQSYTDGARRLLATGRVTVTDPA